MNLRLVLVCLVAGLGFGLPGRSEIEGWVASSRQWMSASSADLEVKRADDGRFVVVHEFVQFGVNGPRVSRPRLVALNDVATEAAPPATPAPAPSSPPLTPETTTPPSFEPITVGDRSFEGLAYELNYFAEGLGTLPRVAAVAAPSQPSPVRPSELVELAIARRGAVAVRLAERLGRELNAVAARELSRPSPVRPSELVELAIARHGAAAVRLAEGLGRELNAVAARELPQQSFLAMEESPSLYFDAPTEAPRPVEVIAKVDAPAPSAFDAMEQSESLYFAGAIKPAAVVAEVVAPAPSAFDVMEQSESLYFAGAIKPDAPETLAAEVDAPAPAAAVEAVATEIPPLAVAARVENAEPTPRVGVSRAVRLTGEALSAWVNVLAGPALVTSSPSSTSLR